MSSCISRSLLRSSNALSRTYRVPQTRRFLSTAPPAQKSRSWKSGAVRWGLAAGAIYYYNTSPFFANNPTLLEPLLPDSPAGDTSLQTLESIAQSRNLRQSPPRHPSTSSHPPIIEDPQATENEASREGAYNEETGEINWDCPCLGGMAQGPCGDQFKAAFSCFVHSKEEPKGMDCIEHFKTMQGCFGEYPDVYGGELEEDEVEEQIGLQQQQQQQEGAEEEGRMSVAEGAGKATSAATATADATARESVQTGNDASQDDQSEEAKTARAKEAKAQVERDHEPLSETDELVPKASHDASIANGGK